MSKPNLKIHEAVRDLQSHGAAADRAAWRAFHELASAVLDRSLRRFAPTVHQADIADLIGDALLRLLRPETLAQIPVQSAAQTAAYIAMTGQRLALDRIDREARERNAVMEREAIERRLEVDRAWQAAERRRFLDLLEHAAAHGLAYEVRLLRLRYVYDLSYSEIARIIDPESNEVTMRKQLERALAKVRSVL